MNTKTANVMYDKDAKCEEFMAFLEQMLPDHDTQIYIQQCMGYAITGSTKEADLIKIYQYMIGDNVKRFKEMF
jgi:hypothetical protein